MKILSRKEGLPRNRLHQKREHSSKIRKAKPKDINDIIKVYYDINIKSMVDDVKNKKYDFIKYINNRNINVYVENNTVIGFVLFFDHITWGYIELLCVSKYHRNKNIGKSLLNSVNNKKWDVVELCCHIDDVETIKFTKRCGFIPSNQITEWYYK